MLIIKAALDAHFGVPAARAVARQLGEWSSSPAEMTIYTAEPAG